MPIVRTPKVSNYIYTYNGIEYLVEGTRTLNKVAIKILGFCKNKSKLVPPKQKYGILLPDTELTVGIEELGVVTDLILIYHKVEIFCFHNAYLNYLAGDFSASKEWEEFAKKFLPKSIEETKKSS